MLAVICMTLLFSVMGVTGGTQETTTETYKDGWGITFTKKELTSEAGLCIVIECSFTHLATFKPTSAVWLKCEVPKCGDKADNDIIFHSKELEAAQSSFRKRVALLEPGFTHKNDCSIIINDLTVSDTGPYQFRVEGQLNGKKDGYTFGRKKTLTVTSLTQKPQVSVPPAVTEGEQTTLTCTAPGAGAPRPCSGTPPNFTWTWRKTETAKEKRINRQSSNWTFTPSSKHDGSKVTCQVTFTGNIKAKQSVTLNVTYLKIRGNTTVEEGGTLDLTCDVKNSPSSTTVIWTTDSNKKLNGTETANLTIPMVTGEHSGRYNCTAQHLNKTMTDSTDITVITLKEPNIRGNTTVEEGGNLTLTCDVKNSPSSTTVIWTTDSNKKLNGTEGANLTIPMVTGEHSGRYNCTAQHLNKTKTAFADITVMTNAVILNGSECVYSLGLRTLTCVCISQGVPLPTITWPILKNISQHSFTTTVNLTTVNSTFSLTVKDHYNTAVECFSKGHGTTVNKTLIIQNDDRVKESKQEGFLEWKTIIAFVIGVTLSMTICCLATAFHRCRKKKNSREQAEVLQMVSCQDQQFQRDAATCHGPRTVLQQSAANRALGAPDSSVVPQGELKEEDYANIDYSKLRQRSAKEVQEAQCKREMTETEYAEVKREGDKKQDSGAEDSGTVEREDEEEAEAMIRQHEEEGGHCGTEEEEGEDTALYANVKAIMLNSGAPDSSVVPQGEVKEEDEEEDYASYSFDYSESKRRQRSAEEEAERKRESTETEYGDVNGEGDKKQDSGAEDSWTVERQDEEEAEAMFGQRGHRGTEDWDEDSNVMVNRGAPDSPVNSQGEVKEGEEDCNCPSMGDSGFS